MEQIIRLKKGEKKNIENFYYVIKKGKVVVRDILPNGKYIGHELFLTSGEIVGDFYSLLPERNKNSLQNVEMELKAVEDSILIELRKDGWSLELSEMIIFQLLKRNVLKYYYQLYDSVGYVLAVLKFYADEKGYLSKKDISPEYFSMLSKSQFYEIMKKIRSNKYFSEINGKIKLKLKEVDNYLENSHFRGKKIKGGEEI